MDSVTVNNRQYHFKMVGSSVLIYYPDGTKEYADQSKVSGMSWENIKKAKDYNTPFITPEKVRKHIQHMLGMEDKRKNRFKNIEQMAHERRKANHSLNLSHILHD